MALRAPQRSKTLLPIWSIEGRRYAWESLGQPSKAMSSILVTSCGMIFSSSSLLNEKAPASIMFWLSENSFTVQSTVEKNLYKMPMRHVLIFVPKCCSTEFIFTFFYISSNASFSLHHWGGLLVFVFRPVSDNQLSMLEALKRRVSQP